MNFFKKLALYLFGVGLGVLAVYFIFGDRDIQCNYFPNDRVLYDLGKKEIAYGEEVRALLAADEVPDSLIVWALERGKVDFENSNARKEPCGIYFIDLENPAYRLQIENCDSTATVQRIEMK